MYQVAHHFSNEEIAKTFQQYHEENAGITRYIKFKYLFGELLNKSSFEAQYRQALTMFSDLCTKKLIACPVTKGALEFLAWLPESDAKFIVSAGSETELQAVFDKKQISNLFTGIYGGAKTKA